MHITAMPKAALTFQEKIAEPKIPLSRKEYPARIIRKLLDLAPVNGRRAFFARCLLTRTQQQFLYREVLARRIDSNDRPVGNFIYRAMPAEQIEIAQHKR